MVQGCSRLARGPLRGWYYLPYHPSCPSTGDTKARILVQVTIYRRLLIGRDGHLDRSEAYDIS